MNIVAIARAATGVLGVR